MFSLQSLAFYALSTKKIAMLHEWHREWSVGHLDMKEFEWLADYVVTNWEHNAWFGREESWDGEEEEIQVTFELFGKNVEIERVLIIIRCFGCDYYAEERYSVYSKKLALLHVLFYKFEQILHEWTVLVHEFLHRYHINILIRLFDGPFVEINREKMILLLEKCKTHEDSVDVKEYSLVVAQDDCYKHHYAENLESLMKEFFLPLDVKISGVAYYRGEEFHDIGKYEVKNNTLTIWQLDIEEAAYVKVYENVVKPE
ncbi:hypothetical protein HK104_002484 [Borealophlyctis nickersoniae]|nr:hypothetical protein HK104_002484 [Borealophlyctis nickersoniae]